MIKLMKLLNETMMSVTPLKHEKWYPTQERC